MNVMEVLRNLKNEPFVAFESACPECDYVWGQKEDVTFKEAAMTALLNAKCESTQKVKRYKLCLKLEKNEELEFSVEEAKILKECIEEISTIVIAGRLMEILDPNG